MYDKKRLYIVNDSSSDRVLLSDLFSEDYEIIQASNGKDALDFLLSGEPHVDVMLLDVFMPGIDGFTVLARLNERGLTGKFPVIATLPDDATNDDVRRAYAGGAVETVQISYISKLTLRSSLELFKGKKDIMARLETVNDRRDVMREINGAMMDRFSSVFYVNIATMEYYTCKGEDSVMHIIPRTGEFEQVKEDAVDELVYPDDRDDLMEKTSIEGFMKYSHVIGGYRYFTKNYRLIVKDRIIWKRLDMFMSSDELSDSVFYTFTNIDEEKRAEYEDQYYDIVIAAMTDIYPLMYELDIKDKQLVSLNLGPNGLSRRFVVNYADNDQFSLFVDAHIHPDDRADYLKNSDDSTVIDTVNKNGSAYFEYRIRFGIQKKYRWYSFETFRFDRSEGPVYLLFGKDINDTKMRMLQRSDVSGSEGTMKMSLTDPLTGLSNRQGFYAKTEELIRNGIDRTFYVIVLDIYRFKIMNEIFGTDRCDKLLTEMAKGARTYSNLFNIVLGRLDSDRFAATLDFTENQPDFREAEIQIKQLMKKIMPEYEIVIYFGAYKVTDPTIPPQTMCDRAITALMSVQGDYNKRYAVYDDDMEAELRHEQVISSEMAAALNAGDFEVYYQPIINIKTNHYTYAEALVRWNHKTRGVLRPVEFMDVFEKTGYIVKLDEYVIRHVCADIKRFRKQNGGCLPISVNISSQSAADRGFTGRLMDILNDCDVKPGEMMLEFKEDIFSDDPSHASETLSELKRFGFRILMDRFGTDYTLLNVLKDIDINFLKIDLRAMGNIEDDEKTSDLVTSVIRMSRMLGLPMIIEGVESKKQIDFLNSIGCQNIQGYYYSKPLRVDDFSKISNGETENIDQGRPALDFEHFDIDSFISADPRMEILLSSLGAGVGIYLLSNGKVTLIKANKEYYNIMGYSEYEVRMVPDIMTSMIVKEDADKFFDACSKAVTDGQTQIVRIRKLRPDKSQIWIELRIRSIDVTEHGNILCFTVADMTQIVKSEQDIKAYHESVELLDEVGFSTMLDYDAESDLLSVSFRRKGKRPLNKKYEHYLSKSHHFSENAEDDEKLRASLKEAIKKQMRGKCEFRALDFSSGVTKWFSCEYISLPDASGKITRVVGRIDDIEQLKAYQRMAERDTLTGIYNSDTFFAKLPTAIEDCGDKPFSVLCLDIDDMRLINRKFSHAGGDSIIKLTADYLKNSVDKTTGQIFSRTDGDEFCIFLPRMNKVKAQAFAEQITKALSVSAFDLGCDLSFSAGISSCEGKGGCSADTMYKKAQIALFDAKNNGKGTVVCFSDISAGFKNPDIIVNGENVVEYVMNKLSSCTDIRRQINELLEYLGKQFALTDAYAAELGGSDNKIVSFYEWNTSGGRPVSELYNEMTISDRTAAFEYLASSDIYYCSDCASAKERSIPLTASDDIKSMLCSVLTDKDGNPWGMIGFNDRNRKRLWTQQETDTLRFMAHILGVFLKHDREIDNILLWK